MLFDLCSRRVIGWAMSAKPDQHVTIEALHMAFVSRLPHQGLVHHTDQGAAYESGVPTSVGQHGITASMSREDNGCDNAVAA